MSLLLQALQRSHAEHRRNNSRSSHANEDGSGGNSFTDLGSSQVSSPRKRLSSSRYAFEPYNTVVHTSDNQSWFVAVLTINAVVFLGVIFLLLWQNQSRADSSATNAMLTQALVHEITKQRAVENQHQAQVARTSVFDPVEHSLADAIRQQTNKGRNALGISSPNTQLAQQKVHIGGKEIAKTLPPDTMQREDPLKPRATLDSVARLQPTTVPLHNTTKTILPSTTQPLAVIAGLDPKKVYNLDELPYEAIQDFPTLHYNAHLYSPDLPKARMFMANDKSYSEKDRIDGNTRVDQIVAEGVIFQFKGLKVKINVVDELQ